MTYKSPDARRARPPRLAGAIAAAGFLVVAGYQVLLALGLASAVSAIVLVLAALIVSGRAGFWGRRVPAAIFRWGIWVLVGGMALSALTNFASPTAGERFFLGPSALLRAFLCFAATRGPAHSPANIHTHVSPRGRPESWSS